MQPRRALPLLVLTVLMTVASGAVAGWLSTGGDGPAAPTVRVTAAEPDRAVVEVTLAGVVADVVSIEGRAYTAIDLPGCRHLLEPGAPQLPSLAVSLAIPGLGTPQVRVRDARWREFATAPPVPSRGSLLRTVDPRRVPHTFGPAYDGGVYPPRAARLSRPYLVHDRRGTTLHLHPVRWEADRGVLRVLERIVVEVTTAGAGGVNTLAGPAVRPPGVLEALQTHRFANLTAPARYELNPTDGPMLVVCHDAFVAAMAPFVQWKRERGIPVELITTSSVGGMVAGIQAAIDQRYHGPDGLAYVVLVGDGQQVPHYTGTVDGADDDTRYVRLAGDDAYPDALISRISAQTPDQVATQVAKFVAHERDTAGAAAWTDRAAGIASDEDGDSGIFDWERMDLLRDRLLAHQFTQVDRIYEHLDATGADIAAAVADGRSLVNYMGHGNGLAWSSVPFGVGDVHQLTNTAWPWIVDVACLNGNISSLNESFAEAWLRAGSPTAPHGAVGVYASATSCAWVEPTVMQQETATLLTDEASRVLGVLVHGGVMAALDQYGEEAVGLRLVEQFNLFGDCSLVVRTAPPAPLAMAHQPVLPLGIPEVSVATGVPQVSVTITAGEVIHGTAVTNSQGHAEVVLDVPLTLGTATLTVFGHQCETYQAALPVADLAQVSLSPRDVPVGTGTAVTVTVTSPVTGAGLPGVAVDIDGFGHAGEPVDTDQAGQAILAVTPAFGEVLQVRGCLAGNAYDLFALGLPVIGAMPPVEPAITASVPDIALDGALTPDREGLITASLGEAGFTLFVRGDGLSLDQTTSDTSLTVPITPVEWSPVTAVIGRPGHDIFQQEIAVVVAEGTLGGTVVDADDQAPLAGALVRVFAAGADPFGEPLYHAVTDTLGAFEPSNDLPVGSYDVYVTRYVYQPLQETVTLLYGANEHAFAMTTSPTGELQGTMTALAGGAPLDGTVSVRRADNDELVTTAATDPATGAYATGPLPYHEYRVTAAAFGFTAVSRLVTVSAPVLTEDFALATTRGELLVLDDDDPEALAADLVDLGYNVTVEAAAGGDLADWAVYDLVIYAAGAADAPLADEALRQNLLAHVRAGGRLLLEGGDVAFVALDEAGYPELAAEVLHVAQWHGDAGGEITVRAAQHAVMSLPNQVPDPLDLRFYDWSVADRVTETAAAARVGGWTAYPDQASVICHDDDLAAPGGQTVFFLFEYAAADAAGRTSLLENAVLWLQGKTHVPTSVAGDELPARLTLAGNHPNPFNPRTVIAFALPAPGAVELTVHDLRGRRVRTLIVGDLAAGAHRALWRGCNDTGRPVASGTYFYRLTAAGQRRTGKMLLVR